MHSFNQYAWAVNIRGPESGGKIKNLPIYFNENALDDTSFSPIEVAISETEELIYSDMVFIPLSYYKNKDYACFFSVNSIQKPAKYTNESANANSKINSRLPYVF